MKKSRFGNNLHLIYTNELEVKDTTDTQMSASYIDLHLEIDNGGILKTKLYDNFPFISSNIPASPACAVYISQLIRYSRDCTVIFWTELSC